MSGNATLLSEPHTKRGRLQRIVLKMLRDRENQADALPTNVRFLFYELVQQRVIPKSRVSAVPGAKGRRADQDLSDAVMHLREVGLVPWEWIVDETRSMTAWTRSSTVLDWVIDYVKSARIDPWRGRQPPAILNESRSLRGVLEDAVAYEYLVDISSTNGQCGGHLRTGIAPNLKPGQTVLYLGDWDWQGQQIEDNTRRVLEACIGGKLDWHRIAVTEEQIEKYELPRIKKADRRYKPIRYHDAVETEALSQTVIVRIVREWLDRLLPEPLDAVRVREAREIKTIERELVARK